MNDVEYLNRFNDEYGGILEERGPNGLSPIQRDFLCIISFQGEVNNGGMHQYLLNSSGDLARETPKVLQRIGAGVAAELLERANAYFGPDGPPTDRELRIEQLCNLAEENQQEIHDLTGEFYAAEDQGLSLADLLDAYVLSQRQSTSENK